MSVDSSYVYFRSDILFFPLELYMSPPNNEFFNLSFINKVSFEEILIKGLS